MNVLDPYDVRGQFPALSKQSKYGRGTTAIYFDGPGASQMPITVNDAMTRYIFENKANAGGAFETSENTTNMVYGARSRISNLLDCDSAEVVFGANASTSIFQFSRALSRDWNENDEVIVTKLDHYANVSPWVEAANDKGATVKTIGFDPATGAYRLSDFENEITDRTRIVAVNYACNAIGTISPIKEICEIAHKKGALVFVDAVHYAPHRLISIYDLGCDFLVTSVYKYFGPHVSATYGRRDLLDHFRPYRVTTASEHSPQCWETGTPDFQAISGIEATVGYIGSMGTTHLRTDNYCRHSLEAAFEKITNWENELSLYFLEEMAKIPDVKVYGITDPNQVNERTPTFGITVAKADSHHIAKKLAERGIFTWGGHFYAPGVIEEYGLEDRGGMVRIGFLHYNTKEEIDRLVGALHFIIRYL